MMFLVIKKNIPNLFTAANLICGVLAIICISNGLFIAVPIYVLLAAVFDFLDGFVARILKVQNEMGKQLDSLADMVTFGIVPGVLMFYFLHFSINYKSFNEFYIIDETNFFKIVTNDIYLHANFIPYIAFLIPIMSMFRLAKFNLDTRQSDSFIGLPTPANTLFFLSYPILLYFQYPDILNSDSFLNLFFNPYIMIFFIILFSFLLVAEIPLFSLKFKHFKWKDNQFKYILLFISLILVITLFHLSLPLIIILYLILSLINNLQNKK